MSNKRRFLIPTFSELCDFGQHIDFYPYKLFCIQSALENKLIKFDMFPEPKPMNC